MSIHCITLLRNIHRSSSSNNNNNCHTLQRRLNIVPHYNTVVAACMTFYGALQCGLYPCFSLNLAYVARNMKSMYKCTLVVSSIPRISGNMRRRNSNWYYSLWIKTEMSIWTLSESDVSSFCMQIIRQILYYLTTTQMKTIILLLKKHVYDCLID